jgi:hypothetical protein
MSDQVSDEGHEPRHKFIQHDFDPADEDRSYVDDLDGVWADAMTPEEYVLSSEEAMASAIEQSEHDQ